MIKVQTNVQMKNVKVQSLTKGRTDAEPRRLELKNTPYDQTVSRFTHPLSAKVLKSSSTLTCRREKKREKGKINAQASINNITLVNKAECVHEDLVRDTGNPAFE